MLSTMTTSENFPLTSQSECPRSPFGTTIQPAFLASLPLKNAQTSREDESIYSCCLLHGSTFHREKLTSSKLHRSLDSQELEKMNLFDASDKVFHESEIKENDFLGKEVPRNKLESELSDSFEEQLETDDPLSFDHSKPLKIDPNVLKLDFSNLTSQVNRECNFDKLCLIDFYETKRATHHLSGGCLLTNVSGENFQISSSDFLNNKLCKFSGMRLISAENMLPYEKLVNLNLDFSEISRFLNQIDPPSPFSFDLSEQKWEGNTAISRISTEKESTNPFKNFSKCVLEEDNIFPATNPFNDCNPSSLHENPSINLMLPKYENISLNQKSFSQSFTPPVSPILKPSDEPFISNPFLVDGNSLATDSFAENQFATKESRYTNSENSLSNSSSFILAVPVFSILQHKITESSTQTIDSSKPEKQPLYQNVPKQLSKFMRRNDHSEYDFQCLRSTMKDLRNSGWYYENASWQESAVLLTNTEPGTFLIRDSSDPNFLYSLSVQTSRGPTSVRIHYVNGQFRLDAEKNLIPYMPSFNSVIELIDHYVESTVKNKCNNKMKLIKKTSKHKLQHSKNQVWIDAQGNIYSNILLMKPLYKKECFSSLQHLTRLVINKLVKRKLNAKVNFNFRVTPVYESSPFQDSSFQRNFDNFCPILNIDALPLPSKLLEYLKEYPYCH